MMPRCWEGLWASDSTPARVGPLTPSILEARIWGYCSSPCSPMHSWNFADIKPKASRLGVIWGRSPLPTLNPLPGAQVSAVINHLGVTPCDCHTWGWGTALPPWHPNKVCLKWHLAGNAQGELGSKQSCLHPGPPSRSSNSPNTCGHCLLLHTRHACANL